MQKTKLKSIKNNTPTILVVFGVTGDLAAKKIIPSLWHLFLEGRLPDKLSIVGFSRRKIKDTEFHTLIRKTILKHGGAKGSKEKLSKFFKLFSYQPGKFEDQKAYQTLKDHITKTEDTWGVCANKLFYLAVPPISFKPILKNLASAKLNIPCGGELGWSRILVEKPFGIDLKSAKELQALLSSYFKEEQIYRIDHYLFKEIVQGIENFRFSNNLFENIWDETTIERIDIRLLESIGVEDRGNFYDSIGTLRDVVQNHVLSILALLTMEQPKNLDIDSIRENRANILEALTPWTKKTIKQNTYRAQYDGYKNIKGVDKKSKTETYLSLKTNLTNNRWKDIPILIEAGKRMAKSQKEIVLTLKHPEVCLLCETAKNHGPNKIVFRLNPNDEIIINFWTKKPGFEKTLEERTFSFFLYEKKAKVQYVEEYAKIINAATEGDRSLFVSPEEIEASWKFTDPISKAWKNNTVPLEEYKPDTTPTTKIFKNDLDDAHMDTKPYAKKIGIIGLGKMGANLAKQLHKKNWSVVGYNRTPSTTKELETIGIEGAYSLKELVKKLPKPRTVWLMVPHQVVDKVLDELVGILEKGDTIIDGGNSPYKESIKRNKKLTKNKINFLDVGVSGGPDGALNGACLMVGGDKNLYKKYKGLFKDMSVKQGYGYMGKSGAGHFVKMVHNGIEYGMMQSIGEGFEVIKKSSFSPNLLSVAQVYNHGSVITSNLVGWLVGAYKKFGDELDSRECCSGKVSHSGEGQWTVDAAHELGVPVSIIKGALDFRKKSQKNPSYTGKVVSALRHEFGGHEVKPIKK
jgi:glucose-6-phosphate 1-dehydrogenase